MTPTEAREMALLCFADHRNALWSLADQVEALTKERDEYAKAADTQAMAHKVERDALMAAAKLALDFLEHIWREIPLSSYADPLRFKAEAALRKAGVQ